MAGLQAADFVTFSRLAWKVYQYGWTDEYNGSKQYNEFGADVRGLAQSLDILSDVVAKAQRSLDQQGAPNALVRWDPVSLGSIVGDYQGTLKECKKLLDDNYRYNTGRAPIYNITWNSLLQPTVDLLRQRIALHNSKLLLVLKPFEIDILCRVRDDIQRVHHDLALRITALHIDLRRLIGVVVPDLEVTLNQQAAREIRLLQVPPEISERFRTAALVDHPYHDRVNAFRLEELSDAFVLNYRRSTVDFQGGFIVAERVPSLQEYLNLLKCVWLIQTMRSSGELPTTQTNSHWPSYVAQLEDDLSTQCSRFDGELVPPNITSEALTRDMFTIWPEKPPEQLVDVVTQNEMMELIVEVPLESSGSNIERSMKLLRRLDSGSRRFRIVIFGAERPSSSRSRQQTEVIDFDITSHILQPQYALPLASGATRDFILRRDERVARLSFTTTNHLLKFQQAITGYKAFASWTQYNAIVSFVREGHKDPITERACIQLWLPRSMDGSFVTSVDIDTSFSAGPSRSTTMNTATGSTSASGSGGIPIPGRNNRGNSLGLPAELSASPDRLSTSPMSRQTSMPSAPRPASYGQAFSHSSSLPRQTASPPLMGFSPPRGHGVSFSNTQFQPSPGRRPTVSQSPNPQNGGFLQPPSPMRHGNGRSPSVSSAISNAPTNASNSSGSDGVTATVSVGANGSGFLHRRQAKPLLVIFAQNLQTQDPSFVTVELDEKTAVNPERCDCRQSGRGGAACLIAAIEQNGGTANLVARRFESPASHGEMDWNMAYLANSNPASSSSRTMWPNLKRLSIMFPQASDRDRFSGTPSNCHCRTRNQTVSELSRCLAQGHKGYLGEVLEYYRKKGHEYHRTRNESQVDVHYGLPS